MTKRGGEWTIIARRVMQPIALNASHPAHEWESAGPISFCTDWRGENPNPALNTEIRLLWSPETLYIRFACRYREICVFDDSDSNGRRDHLWDRDVAEVFLQPPDAQAKSNTSARNSNNRFYGFYKEFEIAPNGLWLDLDISPVGGTDLRSRLSKSGYLDQAKKIWSAEMAIPMRSLTNSLDPSISWRANFYRIEGAVEPRAYFAWRPTMTPEPNFHVPEEFGILRFED